MKRKEKEIKGKKGKGKKGRKAKEKKGKEMERKGKERKEKDCLKCKTNAFCVDNKKTDAKVVSPCTSPPPKKKGKKD